MSNRLCCSLAASLMVIGLASLPVGLGCAAQADPNYRGEPLATFKGSVVTQGPAPAHVDAAIVWMTSHTSQAGYTTKIVGSRASVDGAFPASFTLDVFAPPPKEGELQTNVGSVAPDYQPTGAWVGMIVAIGGATDDANVHPNDVVGTDVAHLVVYFDHDLAADAETSSPEGDAATIAAIFHVPPTKGYHLAKNDPGTPQAEAAYDQCRWAGLCLHAVGIPDAVVQAQQDWDYARCTDRAPTNERCTHFSEPASAAERAEDRRCSDLQTTMRNPSQECKVPWSHPDNPQGFSDPVTVILGKSIWDLWVE